MQKENKFFFSFPNESTFGEANGTDKRAQIKEKACFFFICRVQVLSAKPMVRLSEHNTK